jgi:putative hydrolase of the HAD superfamily
LQRLRLFRYKATSERAWWGAFLREVLARLDHPAPWRPLLDDLYRAFAHPDVWHAFPDALKALHRLHSRGLALAVISNWDGRLPDILAGLGMARFFSVVTVSSLEGVEKPSPEIFWRTLDRLGVVSEQAIHVGNSPHDDYHGAERAGLIPVLLDREGLFTQPPFRRISSLERLVELT